jgi:hypothetical protein
MTASNIPTRTISEFKKLPDDYWSHINTNGAITPTPPLYTTPAEEMPVIYGPDWIYKKQHQHNQVQALSCVEKLDEHVIPGTSSDFENTWAFKNYGLTLYAQERGFPQPAFSGDSPIIRQPYELHRLNTDSFITFDHFVIAKALKIKEPVTIFDRFILDCLEQGLVPTLQYGAFKNNDMSQFEPML